MYESNADMLLTKISHAILTILSLVVYDFDIKMLLTKIVDRILSSLSISQDVFTISQDTHTMSQAVFTTSEDVSTFSQNVFTISQDVKHHLTGGIKNMMKTFLTNNSMFVANKMRDALLITNVQEIIFSAKMLAFLSLSLQSCANMRKIVHFTLQKCVDIFSSEKMLVILSFCFSKVANDRKSITKWRHALHYSI